MKKELFFKLTCYSFLLCSTERLYPRLHPMGIA